MKKSLGNKITNIICLLCLIGVTVYLIVIWDTIPDIIPAHFDALGQPDRMDTKASALISPIMNWILYMMISVVELFPQAWNTGVKVTEENKERVYGILRSLIATTKLITILIFTYLTICTVHGKALAVWFFPAALLAVFGTITIHLILLYRSGK